MRRALFAVGLTLGLALANAAAAQPAASAPEAAELPAPADSGTDAAPSRKPIWLGLIAALLLVMGAMAVVNDKHHDHGKPKSRRS